MTDPNILAAIRTLKAQDISPPFVIYGLPCNKKVWFDARGRILATTTAPCFRLAHQKRWKKPAAEMSPAEYERAKKRLFTQP